MAEGKMTKAWGGTSTVCTTIGVGEEGANCAEPLETAQSSVFLPSPGSDTSVNLLCRMKEGETGQAGREAVWSSGKNPGLGEEP